MSKKTIGLTVILVGAAALAVAAYLHWKHGQIYPSTSDAYVGGDVVTVATGGLAEMIAPETSAIEAVDRDLTLHGLRIIWERNR